MATGSVEVADTVLQAALTDTQSAELLELAALIAESRGQRARALALYRAAIASHDALTPIARLSASRNLAALLAHEDPSEARRLYERCLESMQLQELDPGIEPLLRNGLGYAQICCGDLGEAERQLEAAAALAVDLRPAILPLVDYNRSILSELRDDLSQAFSRIAMAEAGARRLSLEELVCWCLIRRAWVQLKEADRDGARASQLEARQCSHPVHRQALATLDALFNVADDECAEAAPKLRQLAAGYREQADVLTSFTLLRWLTFAYRRTNQLRAAVVAQRQASEIECLHLVQVSPNWWAREVMEELPHSDADSAARHGVRFGITRSCQTAVVVRQASIFVDSRELDASAWQQRTGSRVLRRLFLLLTNAYPGEVRREELSDELWPNSDGDRAVRNLYSATRDLRRVLAHVPGLRLTRTDERYRLEAEPTVLFEGSLLEEPT